MSLLHKMAGGGGSAPTYVDDVFSAYTYTGNGSTQTITNGIDLSGKGGLVWEKQRGAVGSHKLWDSSRSTNSLATDTTAAQTNNTTFAPTFNSTGYVSNWGWGGTQTLISWTFRKAAKFFDVVTYTGNGTNNRAISHSLGQTPGMVIVKNTGRAGQNWPVYHRSTGANTIFWLNATSANSANTTYFPTAPDASSFYVGTDTDVNQNGDSYVAYLFAHDTVTDGLIQCGSFTTDGSGNATVTLGWEPQFVMSKASSATGGWYTTDTARGMSYLSDKTLSPNTSAAELDWGTGACKPNATGFVQNGSYVGASTTYIYLAIRRPNKPPTTGTQVYNAIARTGTGAAATVTGVGFAPDLVVATNRTKSVSSLNVFVDRLRGNTVGLTSTGTTAESGLTSSDAITSFGMDGYSLGTDATFGYINSATTQINWNFRRAPGVFDEVCYTGTGSATTVAHNLGVAPELMIVKRRSAIANWDVYVQSVGAGNVLLLNDLIIPVADSTYWNSTSPTSSVFTVGTAADVNASGGTYVAYLFATKAGISKIGSYTGNGSTQTINCGFSAGSRFILIKKTTGSGGGWFVFDTVRGIIAGNDPSLRLNSTAAETTSISYVTPDNSGFALTSDTNCNNNGDTYIYLAIA